MPRSPSFSHGCHNDTHSRHTGCYIPGGQSQGETVTRQDDIPVEADPPVPQGEDFEPASEGPPGSVGVPAEPSAEAVRRLEEQLDEAKDRQMRLAAEFDNYRKRVERERAEQYGRAQADFARRLLDVVDDLERVEQHEDPASGGALLEGVQLVQKKLIQILESMGLEPVDAAGKVFVPATMEGIATVRADDPEEDDVVSEVFQKGYRFKGQLLRPARVRVKQYEA